MHEEVRIEWTCRMHEDVRSEWTCRVQVDVRSEWTHRLHEDVRSEWTQTAWISRERVDTNTAWITKERVATRAAWIHKKRVDAQCASLYKEIEICLSGKIVLKCYTVLLLPRWWYRLEVCDLLANYTAYSGNFLTTFRYNLCAPKWSESFHQSVPEPH